jgi:hypothetical protein
MARLASVVEQGYFPAPPAAIEGILKHLKIPDPPPDPRFQAEDLNILDPCAGEVKALVQLAEGLGVLPGHVFAVELNAPRAATIAESHPEVRLLGPCSFMATRVTRHSFSSHHSFADHSACDAARHAVYSGFRSSCTQLGG